ncbi:hypothetical protein A2U01_0065119, partial [Trifolium medium]|nr:hypothetical protein [Trifolium medium]
FFGPFKIVQQIGEVAFKLQLPDTSRVHPVFHVSQLKPYTGNVDTTPSLPETSEAEPTLAYPIVVLDQSVNA